MRIDLLLWCVSNYYDFVTHINSNVTPSATVWLKFKGVILRSPILGGCAVLGRSDLCQSKAHPRPHNTFQHKVLLYVTPSGQNFNVKLYPCNSASQFSGRVDLGSKTVPIELSSPHSHSTSIHTIGLSCTVCHNIQRSRQIDDSAMASAA